MSTILMSCEKDDANAVKENEMFVKSTSYIVYRSFLIASSQPGCPNTVAAITSYGANSSGDSCYMFFYNLDSRTAGTASIVEPFISGGQCRAYILGGYKKAGQNSYTLTNSTFEGELTYTTTSYKLEGAKFYDRAVGGLTTYDVRASGKF